MTKRIIAGLRDEDAHLQINGAMLSALAALAKNLGREFDQHIGTELRDAFRSQEEAASRAWRGLTEQLDAWRAAPGVATQLARIERARSGDPEAITAYLRDDPFVALADEMIVNHIETNRPPTAPEEAEFLEAIAAAFRLGLLMQSQGRRKKIHDPSTAVEFAAHVQELADTSPIKLKKRYRNSAARDLDAATFAASLVSRAGIEPAHRDVLREFIRAVVREDEGLTRRFGLHVAAKVFCCTPQHLSSLRRQLRT
jgi:hypothetical protein